MSAGVDAVCAFFSLHYYYKNPAIYQMLQTLKTNAVFIAIIINKDSLMHILDKTTLTHKSKNYEYQFKNNKLAIRLPFSDKLMTEDLADIPELINNMKRVGYKLSINQ